MKRNQLYNFFFFALFPTIPLKLSLSFLLCVCVIRLQAVGVLTRGFTAVIAICVPLSFSSHHPDISATIHPLAFIFHVFFPPSFPTQEHLNNSQCSQVFSYQVNTSVP